MANGAVLQPPVPAPVWSASRPHLTAAIGQAQGWAFSRKRKELWGR